MIKTNDETFVLETDELSYVFHVNKLGLLEHDHFGNKIELVNFDVTPLKIKQSTQRGTSVQYKVEEDDSFSLDYALLEFSFPNKGDFRITPVLLKNKENGYVFEFTYDHYEIKKEVTKLKELPTPHDADDELVVYLVDKVANVEIELHYLVFEKANVIARNIVIRNKSSLDLQVLKALSYQFDVINHNFQLMTFFGAWTNEMHRQVQTLNVGTFVNESRTGNTSNRHNPLMILKEVTTNFYYGAAYGFNLIYSGNHLEEVELSPNDNIRVEAGINNFCFDLTLKENESFNTPFAILSYSNKGMNGLLHNMHDFVNNNVIPTNWNKVMRPVVINNWEATYFKFKERQLVSLAKTSKKYGAELFVLDDGWFSNRNDDKHGLGDYDVNKKKLPHGLNGLAKKINKIGLKFGLWFEPESVNIDSKLYKAHPEWAITNKGRVPSKGRNQLLLNLGKKEVQDYIIENVSNILKSANIEFVKWDMNRNMSDISFEDDSDGIFFHNYIVGLYRVLDTLTTSFPNVLFEGCASGGNRFDLGMLSYFPQMWASDDTDPLERIFIQSGYYMGYPLSTISCHVANSPSHQLLRQTPVDSRFNVAMFGVLGYELLFKEMSKNDRKRIKPLIDFYKENRETFQYGQFDFVAGEGSQIYKIQVYNKEKDEAIVGAFIGTINSLPKEDQIRVSNLKDDVVYSFDVLNVEHDIRKFGGNINAILPIHLNPNGFLVNTLANIIRLPGEKEHYIISGRSLKVAGVTLNPRWSATGFNENVRVMVDFDSRIYKVAPIDLEKINAENNKEMNK